MALSPSQGKCAADGFPAAAGKVAPVSDSPHRPDDTGVTLVFWHANRNVWGYRNDVQCESVNRRHSGAQ